MRASGICDRPRSYFLAYKVTAKGLSSHSYTMSPPSIFTLLILINSLVSTSSASYVFNKPQIQITTTLSSFQTRIMDQWGAGGGKFAKIPKDSQHPFENRTFGAAKRSEIRGTAAFGSGYPYGVTNQTTLSGRPFPFGVWPLYWGHNHMGADEYGPQLDAVRPGGFVAQVPLRTTTEHFEVADDEVYYAIGDRESLLLLMISYVTWCHVTPAWPSRFEPTSENSTVKLENVIQYFRASSFALATSVYNNTFASISNSVESSPLPQYVQFSAFRHCIENVTINALAIANDPDKMGPLETFILVMGIGGWGICLISLSLLVTLIEKLIEVRPTIQRKIWGRYRHRAQIRRDRETEMRYERYP
ncbi:hypothetical protein FRC19_008877 [Serendipita sp. 401]|nr:hypothetical protein FRC19_008877 [Serendipita sp. 401]KAG8866142.1 hypothetical protein FRC20_009018 [Serendipita sp. 405]KAG9053396.1 hypothetical protein FS842_008255 [Serendipita sp. 407]